MNKTGFEREITVIKGKAHACDRCHVPDSVGELLHVSQYIAIYCEECYKWLTAYPKVSGLDDPCKRRYPTDPDFWRCKRNYGDAIDFSGLRGSCSQCQTSNWLGDFSYHITVSDGKAVSLTCHDCYTNLS